MLPRHSLRSTAKWFTLRRAASSHSAPSSSPHEFPKEGFSGAIWRNTLLLTVLGAACYKYAPEANDDVYLTRWIALYSVPRDVWFNLNVKHTAMQQEVSEQNLLVADARLPKVHRYRCPQLLDQASPFLRPVGMDLDISNAAVRRD